MNLAELVTALKDKGMTHVKTMGPVLPLEKWNPYGMSPGGVNYRETSKLFYHGEILEYDGRTIVRDVPDGELQQGLALGLWEFTKEEVPNDALLCPQEFETATGSFDPAGYDPLDCAVCGCPKSDHQRIKEAL